MDLPVAFAQDNAEENAFWGYKTHSHKVQQILYDAQLLAALMMKHDFLKQQEKALCPGFFLNIENNSSDHHLLVLSLQ